MNGEPPAVGPSDPSPLTDDYRPARAATAASVAVDEHLVVATSWATSLEPGPRRCRCMEHDGWARFDRQRSSRTWSMPSVEDPEAHRADVFNLVAALDRQRLLVGSPMLEGLVPRSFQPQLQASSCIGKRIGLGRSTFGQVTIGATQFVSGATSAETVAGILELLPADASFGPVDRDGIEAFILRETTGRTARVQQLYDVFGNRPLRGRDVTVARQALASTVAALLPATAPDRVLVAGPILWTDAGVALFHPAFREPATTFMRSELHARGVSLLPAGLAQLHTDDAQPSLEVLTLGSDGTSAERIPVTGIVLPGPLPELRAAAVASVAHVVHRWDSAGLAAAAHLTERVPVRAVDNGAPGTELFSSLCDAAWARL
jgi:hypothetical protein